jgi:hypothetical protein
MRLMNRYRLLKKCSMKRLEKTNRIDFHIDLI